jgi:predicted nucleotidyltransferase
MKKEQIEKLRELLNPLIGELGDKLNSIIITGSAVRKERVEGSDIDLLILLNDHHQNFSKEDKKKAQKIAMTISQSAEEQGLDLHIQPPKTVSNWYSLLLKGRPWAITSMIHSQPIYDPKNFQETCQNMIQETDPGSPEERAEKLKKEYREHIQNAEEKLKEGFTKILENVDRSAKLLIEYESGRSISDDEIDEKIGEYIEDPNDREKYENLRETVKAIENEDREPNFTELEEISKKGLELINRFNKAFKSEIEEMKKTIVEQSIEEIRESCKVLLEEENIEYEGGKALEKFEEEIIEPGILSGEYWSIIESTIKNKDRSELTEESVYHTVSGLRELETAINSLMERDLFESFKLQSDTKEARITPVNEFEERLLENYDSEIISVYVLSKEHLLETESANLIIITDSKKDKIIEKANQIEKEIAEEHGFNIHSETRKIQNQWKKLQDGKENLIYEIKTAIVSYDPQNFTKSIKKLVKQGKISETIPNVKKGLESHKIKTILPIKEIKEECLSEYYKASIKKGQAELLKEDITPPVQKKVPDRLEEELLDEAKLSRDKIEAIHDTIKLYKQNEYGNIEQLKAEKMEDIRKEI